jgi:3-hydroxyisobutyrate dehydrogenase-like beta-hydroxyacid dehydrogenase
MSSVEHLGFIGLGNMGGAIALRLLRAGFSTTVLNRVREKMQPLLKGSQGSQGSGLSF